MSRIAKLDLIPAPMRLELSKRLVATRFGDTRGHVEWLAEQGVHVGMTAVNVWGVKNRSAIELAAFAGDAENGRLGSRHELRLRCLEVASKTAQSIDATIAGATRLESWVLRTIVPR